MMERVITQANGRPERRESGGRRNVHAVQELGCNAHWLAVIFPQMRNKRADLVEDHDSGRDAQKNEEILEWNDCGNDHHDEHDRPNAARSLLPRPVARKLAFGLWTHELRIDLQSGIAADHNLAQPL